jgi:cation diffusion facilitator CzcD-associated flavoprotein CzcO/predicted ATP-grasp superfamily ATP-dependent carboligase
LASTYADKPQIQTAAVRRSAAHGAPIDALVADASQRQALVAVRELGRSGLTVGALDSDRDAPGLASRWCSSATAVPDFVESQDAYVDALLGICAEHGPSSLILGHDGSIEALRRRRSEVERVVGLALAPEQALTVAVDKTLTLSFAENLGMRVPRGAFVTDVADAEAAIDDVGLPAVVKPTRSWAQGAGVGQRLVAVVARTRAEALAAISAVLSAGNEVVLQEWLPGDREAISFFHARGRTWARFAQRADRTFPPLGGNSVVRESIPLPADLAPAAERLICELGLDGYSEVEFRRDREGRGALMEINPRLSASVEIAARAGVPFPRLLHDWVSGAPLQEASGYRTGLRMRWLGGDLSWLKSVLKQSSGPDVPSRARALAMFARDFAQPMGYDYLDRSDPRPALSAAGGITRRARRGLASSNRTGRGSASGLDTEVVVIGAGPYGLSVSAHLTGGGVRHESFGETMSLWGRHMPEGMFLKSEGFASNLSHPGGEYTLERFCAENDTRYEYAHVASPIPLRTFESYGRWFQRRAVPELRESRVEQVRKLARGFELHLSTGETLRAGSVVVATGMTGYARLPQALEGRAPHAVLHCYEHRDPASSRGEEVAVIGAGQSALESAALLAEQGARVHVIARKHELAWNSKPGGSARPLNERWKYPESGLGEGRSQWVYANYPLAFHLAPEGQRIKRAYTALGPAGAWWLRERIEGRVELKLGRSVKRASVENGGVRLELEGPSGSEELFVAQVIAGTGYRPDLNKLPFLDPALLSQIRTHTTIGTPLLDGSYQSTAPGLYFVGYPAGLSFGPVMRFVFGAGFAARAVARRLARGGDRVGRGR